MGSSNFRYWFGENLPSTGSVTASKTPSFQTEFHFTALPGQIPQTPEVCTVAAPRKLTAGRAAREVLDVNAQQKPAAYTLDAIEH
jgi:hypothetical protein